MVRTASFLTPALLCLVLATPACSQSQAEKPSPEFHNPKIREYGSVIKFPHAAHQPRPNSRILVDLTGGGDADKLYPSIEKIARFVNIYHGAGKKPADVKIAVVMHGSATLAALNHDAYAKKFGTENNPNLDCMHKLRKAGVEFVVCGQSLTRKGGRPKELDKSVDLAVSGLTALVNLQADGYSYVPLFK